MLISSKSFENHPNSNITFAYDLQEPPHHPETSDLALNNINYENFYFLEKNPPLYGSNYIDKELSLLDSFLEIDTPETFALYEIKACMQKLERPLFLTKKIKRNIDNDNNFFADKTRKKRKSHQKSDFDNILTKIQVHFLNFIINLCNEKDNINNAKLITQETKSNEKEGKKNYKEIIINNMKILERVSINRSKSKNKSNHNNKKNEILIINTSSTKNEFFDKNKKLKLSKMNKFRNIFLKTNEDFKPNNKNERNKNIIIKQVNKNIGSKSKQFLTKIMKIHKI